MVYDFATHQSSALVMDEQITGFDWRPGSNLIAYGLPIDQDYFMNQDASLATGINGVQADTGEITKLVEPEGGYPLVSPRWSPDGRFLAFEEVQYMEGRGLFTLYDFEDQEYQPWEQVIGNYSWSPDSQSLAFDRLAYIPS
jgi:Tol biopolymer transport system component